MTAAVAAAAGALLMAAPARAAPTLPSRSLAAARTPSDEPRPGAGASSPTAPGSSEHWYGYQTLIADGAALGVSIAGVATNDRSTAHGILIGAAIVYAAGAPLVHLAHGHTEALLFSLGLRLGLPVVGGLVGGFAATLAPRDDGDESVRGVALGALLGVAAAVTLDATLLARRRDCEPAVGAASFVWHPAVAFSVSRMQIAAAGTF